MKLTAMIIALLLLVFGSASSARAQEHAYRLSDKEMKELLKRIDSGADKFRRSLHDALNHSRFDDTKQEDHINDFVKEFDKSTDHLKDRFDHDRSAAPEVEEVLRRAVRIDSFMSRHRLSPRAESDWSSLRTNLDELASAYNVSWDWSAPIDR